ncbi:hypothetical protein AWB68_08792 [Caballeronia choica]|uniref:Uncharacterized protein n=1 Tax=Caballeronia choica TaxID=326476 RepID=A0A158L6I5_9BURK|nr:hypothetical protein AWB68_08792 [Caballeronia choica]
MVSARSARPSSSFRLPGVPRLREASPAAPDSRYRVTSRSTWRTVRPRRSAARPGLSPMSTTAWIIFRRSSSRMFSVTSVAGFMDGSCSAAVNRQLASGCKTRHLYLAKTRHSHIASTTKNPIIVSYVNGGPANCGANTLRRLNHCVKQGSAPVPAGEGSTRSSVNVSPRLHVDVRTSAPPR